MKKNIFLTIKNYKEPLLKIPKREGHGYYGTIMCSIDNQYIQCHICGKLFSSLSGHIRGKHKMNVKEYKNIYKLAKMTALVSEKERYRLKQTFINYLKSLTPEQKEEFKQKAIEKWKEWKNRKMDKRFQPKITLETKNKRGTCPDQLLQKIKDVAKKIGKTPTLHEFVGECRSQRFKHLIFKTFGSWKNAIEMCKMSINKKRKGIRHKYNNDELLEYLKIYTEENNKIPTATDCRRGLIPDYYVYIRHFGSFGRARELAQLNEILK